MLLLFRNSFLVSICFLLVIEPTVSVSAPAPTPAKVAPPKVAPVKGTPPKVAPVKGAPPKVTPVKDAPPKVTPSDFNELVSDFCSQRRTVNDRTFCLNILTSNPNLAAEDYPSMLKIALIAAEDDAQKVLDYLNTVMKSKTTNPKLKPVLNDIIQIYDIVVNEFRGMSINIGVDSSLVKLYSHVANDELQGCANVVAENVDIQGITPISNRNKITEKYSVLVEDLAKLV